MAWRRIHPPSLPEGLDLDEEWEQHRIHDQQAASSTDAQQSSIAAAIYCHPNTVRHRLHRIEDLTGRSLSRPKDIAELCLAFEVERRLP